MPDDPVKVMFKRGTNAKLKTLVANSTVQDGTFYLTTDTNRLYIGKGPEELVELNKSITMVDVVSNPGENQTALPTSGVEVGQFYYVSGTNQHTDTSQGGSNGNILAVVTSVASNGTPTWTQINPDTNDNDYLGDVTITKGAYDSTNKVIPYTLDFTIKNKNNQTVTAKSFSRTFNVAPSDIISKADVDISTSSTSGVNAAVVTTKIKDTSNNNALSAGDSFTIAGGSNVTIAESDGTITISTGIGSDSVQMHVDGTTTSNQVSASVRVNNSDSGDILKIAGDTSKDIGITWDGTNKIAKIGHSNSATAAVVGGDIQLANNNKSFTAVTSTTYDAYGHISAQTSQQVTLPSYSIKTVDVDSTDKSKLKVSLTDQNNAEFGAVTSGSILYNTITVYDTIGGSASQSTIANQGDIGTFYSKAAIDGMLKDLDALTYRGTVSAVADIPSSNVQIGDTYKVNAANSGITDTAGNVAKLGDLLIATGTEGNDGYIPSDSLTWTLVQGNSEADTQYNTKVVAGSSSDSAKVGILANNDNNNFHNYVTMSGDGVITLTPTAGENGAGAIALAHADSGVTADTYGGNTAGTISAGGSVVVPQITVNAQGHVTGVTDVTVSLPGENKLVADTTNKKVKLQNSASQDLGTITFNDGNLTTAVVGVSGDNPTITINHAVPTMGTDTTPTQSVDLTSSTEASRQISVISGVTKDTYGHVTALATKTITLSKVLDTLKQASTSGTNTVTVNTQLVDANNSTNGKGNSSLTLSSNGSITLTSTIDSSNNATSVNLDVVWGEF